MIDIKISPAGIGELPEIGEFLSEFVE